MRNDMLFSQLDSGKPRTKPMTVATFLLAMMVAAMLLEPLMFVAAPKVSFEPPIPQPLAKPVIDTVPVPKREPRREAKPQPPGRFYIPIKPPVDLGPDPNPPQPPVTPTGTSGNGTPNGLPCLGLVCGTSGPEVTLPEPPKAQPKPEPKPAPAPEPKAPVRVGGNVQQANLIYQAKPVYPPLAKQVRVQGVVTLEATIDREGNVTGVKVINSTHPLLIQSAVDAVRQWKYRPTLLNGEPVEVVTTVTVKFSFSQ